MQKFMLNKEFSTCEAIAKQANKLSRGIWKQHSILDARILALAISKINKDDNKFSDIVINISSIFQNRTNLGFTDYQNLFKALEKLSSRTIKIIEDHIIKILPFFEYISLDPLDKKLTIKFNEHMKEYLLEVHNNFTLYQIEQLMNLQSIYSQKLFIYLKSFENMRNKKIYLSLKDLYMQFDCEDKYRDFRNFEAKVLNKAFEEINANTDLKFKYTKIKKWRITGIEFEITSKNTNKDNIQITSEFIFDELIAYKMNKKQAYILVNSIDPNILYNKIILLKLKYENETVKIPFSAWLWGCLRNELAVIEQYGKVADDHIQSF